MSATPAEARTVALGKLGRPPTWLTPFGDAWRERWGAESEPPWAEMGQQFKRPYAELERDDFSARWQRFLAAAERSEWARPVRFVQGLGQWAVRPAGLAKARASPPTAREQKHRESLAASITGGLKGDGTLGGQGR